MAQVFNFKAVVRVDRPNICFHCFDAIKPLSNSWSVLISGSKKEWSQHGQGTTGIRLYIEWENYSSSGFSVLETATVLEPFSHRLVTRKFISNLIRRSELFVRFVRFVPSAERKYVYNAQLLNNFSRSRRCTLITDRHTLQLCVFFTE